MGLIDLILREILQGIHDQEEFARVKGDRLKFQVFHSGGSRLALAAAQNYRELRRRGHTVRKTIDSRTATLCLQTKQELLHRDHDFDCFEKVLGLRVVHPA
jgi:predicted nucleic acid-binding protein